MRVKTVEVYKRISMTITAELAQLRHSIELYPDELLELIKRVTTAHNARSLDRWNESSPLSQAQYAEAVIRWINFTVEEMMDYGEDSLLRNSDLTALLESAEQEALR